MALRRVLKEGALDFLGTSRAQKVCNFMVEICCGIATQFDPKISQQGKNVVTAGFAVTALITAFWPLPEQLSQTSNGQQEQGGSSIAAEQPEVG